ncbi:MAG: radical SAM protein [Candidatus Ratteibacteria bacterium]|jgi:radical SAM superfamily enzyme YgiQ (UPF0313 family)
MLKKSDLQIELLIPPNPYLGDEKRNPPLGLLYIASVAEKNGYPVRITDLRSKKLEEFQGLIGDADIYGVTASTPDYPMALEIARIAKHKNSSSWTVLGGIHATAVPKNILPDFDKIVIREGEYSFLQILEDYKNGRKDQRFYESPYITNLDEIPFPARHLLPFDSVFSKNALSINGDYAGTLITARGCPHKCSFCSSDAMWGKRVRFRSPDNIIGELDEMIKKGVRSFRFQDDTMVLKKERLTELCNKMIPLEIKWRTTTRVDHADLDMLNLMKDAGCEEVAFGIESLLSEVWNINSKHINMVQIHDALENTRKAGLKSRLFFIIGLPGEKPGFANRLEEFLKRENPHGVDVSTMVPYPGSDLFNNPQKYGFVLKPEDFSLYHMTLGLRTGEAERSLTFIHDTMTQEQIIYERQQALEIIKQRKLIKNI